MEASAATAARAAAKAAGTASAEPAKPAASTGRTGAGPGTKASRGRRGRTPATAVGAAHHVAQEQSGPEPAASATAGAGATAPAHPAEHRDDEPHHQHKHHDADHPLEQVPEEIAHPLPKARLVVGVVILLIGGAVLGVCVLVGVVGVVALHVGQGRLEELLHPGVVLPGGEVRLQVLIQHVLELGPVEVVLNAGARLGVVVLLANGQKQQQAVVALLGADAPDVEQGVGVVVDVLAVQEVHRHHHNLSACLLEQVLVLRDNLLLCLLREDVRLVQHILVLRPVGIGRQRRDSQAEGQRQGQQQAQGFFRQACFRGSLHGGAPFHS